MTQFSFGLFWISWWLLGVLIPFLVLSWLSTKMSKFIYHISMPETMGRVYGKYPRIITAVLGCVHSITFIATQVYVLSQVISRCIHSVNPAFITILAAILLIAYTIFGGSRSVVWTDIWQFMTFVSLICLLIWLIFIKMDRPISEIFTFVATHQKFTQPIFGQEKLACILRYLALIFGFIEPGYVQPIYMATGPSQAKKVCLYAGLVGFIIMLCCILSGALIFAWLPSDIPQKEMFNYLLLHMSPFFKGILCICLLALTMSTADSRLHVCAVMISYDIVPVLLRVRLRKTLSCVNHYRVAYIAILVIAMLGILLSLTSPTLSPLRAMTNWIYRFYMPIIAAPFILAVLGFRTASHNALIGMATGALAVVAWRKWIYPILLTDSSTFTCILVNGMAILTVHYVWRWSRRTKKLDDDGVETTK